MEILNKLGQVAREAGNLAGMAVEIGKLKVKIRKKQDDITREKAKIGEIMWNKYSAKESVPPEVAERCEKISDHCAEIDILKNAVDAVKSQTLEYAEHCCFEPCPDCGAHVDIDANYCSNCGAHFTDSCDCEDCDCGDGCDCEEEK